MGELLGALNKAEKDISESPISAEQLGGLLIVLMTIRFRAKLLNKCLLLCGMLMVKSADEIISEKGLKQETDTGAIEAVINEVIAASPQQLADYRGGKDKLFGYFVGEVMKRSKGKANPAQVNELLKKALAG
jgi:aspartyl-tRNA(Asn)/glutamyl-tRNA(Gln) amidotransferase subunit B